MNFCFPNTWRTAALALSLAALPAFAQNVIKIGEINSYKAQLSSTPTKRAWSWR